MCKATPAQIKYLSDLCRKVGIVTIDPASLSKHDASLMIDRIKYGKTVSTDLPAWVDCDSDFPAGCFG